MSTLRFEPGSLGRLTDAITNFAMPSLSLCSILYFCYSSVSYCKNKESIINYSEKNHFPTFLFLSRGKNCLSKQINKNL
jgi:hypothetical protein